MMNHMRKCGIYNIPTILNEYNEEIEHSPTLVTYINMAISVLTGSIITSNNVKTINSTHIGITDYEGLSENQVIVEGNSTYTIDFINDTGRKTLVYLKRIKPHE